MRERVRGWEVEYTPMLKTETGWSGCHRAWSETWGEVFGDEVTWETASHIRVRIRRVKPLELVRDLKVGTSKVGSTSATRSYLAPMADGRLSPFKWKGARMISWVPPDEATHVNASICRCWPITRKSHTEARHG